MASKKKSAGKKESGVGEINLDARYKALFETSQDAIMLLDRDRFFDCNPATLKMFGLTKEIFIKLHPSEISPPRQADGSDSRAQADLMIEEAFKSGVNRFDWIHRRSTGEDFPVTVWLTAFQIDGRDVLQATVREITHRVETQMDLEAHRLKLQSLLDQRSNGLKKESMERRRAEGELKRLIKAVETSFNAIALFDMDMNFIYANQAFCRMAAIDSGKLDGMTARDFIPDESLSVIMENIQKNISGDEMELLEVKTHDSQGKEIWIEIAGSVLFDDHGEPDGLLAIINDITERRWFQGILLDRSKILEAMSEGIISFGPGGTLIDVNPAYERITGYSRSDVIGKNGPEIAAQILEPDMLQKVLQAFQRVLSGEKVPPMEVDIKHRDGHAVSIIFTASSVGGGPIGSSIIAVLQDITSIKQAQKALLESEAKFKTLVESSLDGILIIQDGKVAYMNPALLELSGYSMDEQLGRGFIENVAPEDRTKVMEMYRSRLEGKNVPPIYETTLLSKDGRRVPMEVNATIMEYLGRPADFVYLRDLTQRRRAEEEIHTIKEQFEYVLGVTNTGFDIIDEELNVLYVDPKWVEKLGDYRGRKCYDYFMGGKCMCDGCAIPMALETGERTVSEEYLAKEKRYIEVHTIPLKTNGGKRLVAEFNIDITDRKKMLNVLETSESKYRNLVETTGTGYVVLNDTGEVVGANDEYVRMAGHSNLNDILGRKVTEWTAPHDLKRNAAAVKECFKKGIIRNLEIDYIWEDGNILPIELNATTIEIDGSKQIITLCKDITLRRQSEKALRESEERFRRIFENGPLGMITLNRELRFISANSAFCHMIGYSEAELQQITFGDITHPDHLTQDIDAAKKLIAKKIPMYKTEKRYIRKDGGEIWAAITVTMIHDSNGMFQHFLTLIEDITQKKEAEEQLAEKETRYKELARGISSGVVVYRAVDNGKDFEIVDLNRAAETIEKIKREKVIGKRVTEAFPGIKKMGLLDVFKRVWKTGKAEKYPISLYKDERLNSWRENYVYKLPSGEIVAVYDDVTERKTAEEKLRDSEIKYRTLTEKANDAIFLADAETGVLIDVNDKACDLVGRSREELIGMHQSKLHPSKEIKRYMQIFKEHVKKGTAIQEEIVVQHKDGRRIPVSISASVFELQGRLVNQGIFHDLTERVDSEKALREADEKIRTIFNSMEDLVFGFDREGRFISVQTPSEGILYMPEKEFIGKKYSDVMPPHVTKLIKNALKANKDRQTMDFEYDLDMGGEKRWFSAKMSPIFTDEELNGSVAVVRDITEKKRNEEELASSREQLNALFQASTSGIGVEKGDKLFFVNPSFIGMFGYSSADELLGKPLTTIVEPGDRKRLKDYSKLRLKKEAPPRYEFTGLRKDCSTFDAEASVSVYQIGDENYYVGFVQDISSRKRAEKVLQESEARFRRMAENIHDGLTIIENGKVSYVNERAVEIYGYPKEELMKMTHIDLVIQEDREQMRSIIENARKNKQRIGELEFWIQAKDGARRYVRTRLSTSEEEDSRSEFIITTDITARKLAEDETKRRMMKFLLEDGNMYLVKEFRPEMSLDAFNDLLNLGYFGLVMSRTPKKDLSRSVKGGFEYMWLGETDDGTELFRKIQESIEKLGGKSAILIDRMDYLVFKYGFKEAMALVFKLRDIVYLKEQVIIISMDPSTMSEEQLAVMQKEMGEIEARQTTKPPEELFEIAQVIYDRNSTGIKPSYSDVGEALKMSKPTCRKRVRRLISSGYAIELTKGNRKVLELTQKGRSLFFK